jgi:hypothetical protein
MAHTTLTPLLPGRHSGPARFRLREALAADPALVGRVHLTDGGDVVLTGPGGGPAPASLKERRRWELHVRLRLAAELGDVAAAAVATPWAAADGSLTYSHTVRMVSHMKTTLNIEDSVMARLRRESARTGRTMSELVETALRLLLERHEPAPDLPPLPVFDSGGALVDIADRDALYRAMEEEG